MISLGAYPDVSLKLARERRDETRKQLAVEIDPAAHRRAERAGQANTFKAIADEWIAKQNFSPKTLEKAEWTFRDLLNPFIGTRPITAITAPEVLAVLRRLEERGKHETAHRTKQRASQVFRYAIATGRAERDPTADLRGAALAVPQVKSALLAVVYGSRERHDGEREAITDELGADAAKRFRAHPRVKSLTSELTRLGRHIVVSWPRIDGGRLVNAAGYIYDPAVRKAANKKDTLNTRLAHIVQGWEVKMLSAVVADHADKIMLLEHDGWTARESLGSVESVERLIREKTGFLVRIEAKRLELPEVLRREVFSISSHSSVGYRGTSVL